MHACFIILCWKKTVERDSDLRAAERELDEMNRAQHTAVYSWSCGNSDRTSYDQDKIGPAHNEGHGDG